MDKLIYAAVGLGAAYLLFGNKGTNAPIPPTGGGGGSITDVNNFVPVTQPGSSTGLVVPRGSSGPIDLNVYNQGWNSPLANVGAARGYGNCMCRDGSQCVGQGNCACCDKRGGAIAPHTVILPFVKRAVAPVVKTNSANILG